MNRLPKSGTSPGREPVFKPPLTVTHRELLLEGSDDSFREAIYTMLQVCGRLERCRESFGRSIALTGSQFAVLYGTAYRQGTQGLSIRALATYIHLAPTHVTTEVGRLIRLGLLSKRTNKADRRSVLVKLSLKGESTILSLAPFLRHINNILFRDVGVREFQTTFRLFQKLVANTEQALVEIRQCGDERRGGRD